jgi:hypothetical protein
MRIRHCSIYVFLLLGLQVVASGQDQSTQPPDQGKDETRSAPAGAVSGILGLDTQSSANDTSSSDMPHLPAVLGGQGSSLAFLPEMERSNYLRAGINVGAAYDDNALLGLGGAQVGNETYSVFPNIAIDQTTSRTRWSLAYGGGLSVNQRLSSRNQGSHDLNFDSQFRLSPHVNFRAAEDFSLTAGIFGTNSGLGFQPGVAGSNGILITPLANTRSSQTVVETNYHFALRDVVGASGSFFDLHYSNVSTGQGSLANTRTAGGSAFWLHELFHRDWGGINYRFQRMTFDPNGVTTVHTFSIVNTIAFSKAFTISAFIGPEYYDNHGVMAFGPNAGEFTTSNGWSVAGGVEGGWKERRTSVTGEYSRQISTGGGILGAVQLQAVHAAFRRELFSGWSATLGVGYGSNGALTLATSNTATSIRTTSFSASLERNIGRSWGLQMGYFHDLQSQSGSSIPSQNFDATRNRYSATLSYRWTKALGR